MDRVRVSSWVELQEELFAGAWQEHPGRFRSDFAFRGEADGHAHLTTSLVRLGRSYGEVETYLLHNFRKSARREAVPEDSLWNWLGLAAFDALAEDDEFVVFFEPPSLDDRIVNQAALFSLMPSPHAQLADWLERRPDFARVLVLPAEPKWEIRDKLDQANVTERVLFPGLDGLSRWLARYHAPSPGKAVIVRDARASPHPAASEAEP